jgi:hypothetical protein
LDLCPEGKKFTLLLADNGILLCNQVLQVVFCDRFGTRRAVIVPIAPVTFVKEFPKLSNGVQHLVFAACTTMLAPILSI